jgi:DNA repair photolyase
LTLSPASAKSGVQDALFEEGDVVTRTFDTPEFRGMTFYEVRARSIINRVPGASRMPFEWTINPYRGCGHACRYCFARRTHEYLDLDSGADFDSKVVVKVNAPELVRKELRAARWAGRHIAMGTNVDPYQRAEGRYRLMRGILEALRDAHNPFSILTKGTLVLRDLDLLREAAQVTDVSVNVSVGLVDEVLWRQVEPGTPAPRARLGVCRTLAEAGIGCGVLMAPILPYLTDSPSQLDATVRAIAESGARSVSPIVLHLRPGAREWYLAWLERDHPDLVPRYRELYRGGSYAPKAYQRTISAQVAALARRYGVGATGAGETRLRSAGSARTEAAAASAQPDAATRAEPEQPMLL